MKIINENVERLHRYLGVNSTKSIMPHIKRFIGFLYDNNIYSSFMYNFINATEQWEREEHKKCCDAKNFILNAFDWASTPQGHSFWSDHNETWKRNYFRFIDSND